MKSLINPIKFLLPFLIICLSCSTNETTGKKTFLLTSESQEISQGLAAYREILQKEKVSSNYRINAIVQNIGQRLARVSGRPDYKWEFKVIESNQANAFCLPGGKIAVYTGIFKFAKNEAGLAAIIGHEIAHALARHGGQRISLHMATTGVLLATDLLTSNKLSGEKRNLLMGLLGVGSTLGVALPFSRSHETEADEIGLILMAKAGYDPREAANVWDRFSVQKSKVPTILSTHPNSGKRRDHLRRLAPNAMKFYQNANEQMGLGQEL